MELLGEQGVDGATMSAIAARVKMSKETLYSIYGSKESLFADLVSLNSLRLNEEIVESLSDHHGERTLVPDMLARFGEKLLALLTSHDSIVLNRVAIAALPLNSQFSLILTEKGRETTLPLLKKMIAQASTRGELPLKIPENAAELFIGLLMGELQIKRLLGVEEAPDELSIQRRAQKTVELFVLLMNAMQNA